MPYLEEYLLCEHFHWSWRDVQDLPRPVYDLFALYRNIQAQIRNAEASSS